MKDHDKSVSPMMQYFINNVKKEVMVGCLAEGLFFLKAFDVFGG